MPHLVVQNCPSTTQRANAPSEERLDIVRRDGQARRGVLHDGAVVAQLEPALSTISEQGGSVCRRDNRVLQRLRVVVDRGLGVSGRVLRVTLGLEGLPSFSHSERLGANEAQTTQHSRALQRD